MEQIAITIIAIMVLLATASMLVPVADRLRVPHAVLLAALGMAVGLVTVVVGSGEGTDAVDGALRSYDRFQLDAEVLLYVFLPALLFTAGLTVDVRRMLDEVWAVLLLAVVAVLVCAGLVGFAVHMVSGMDLATCVLLGAVIATTDPAAVIAVFRELGAPRRLTILVQGESLLNDAAAIAVFAIVVGILTGQQEVGGGSATLKFLEDFIGGAILGYLFARVAFWLIGRLDGELGAEITITIALAYLSFILGERYFHVSGVVAVAVASLTVAAYGPVRLSPDNWRTLTEIWHHLEFWAASLIFLLAAIAAGHEMSHLHWNDLGLIGVLIVGAIAARAIVLYGFLPGLAAVGLVQPVDGRYKAVILWGGLRGAVTMALALAVAENQALPEETRRFVAILAIGFVLFTLFVSAPTLRPLLRLLGLDKLDPVEAALRNRVVVMSHASLREQIAEFAKSSGMDAAAADRFDLATPEEEQDVQLSKAQRMQVGLLTLASREKSLYLERAMERAASRRLVAILVSAADRMNDQIKSAGVEGYKKAANDLIAFPRPFRIAHWLHRRFGWSQSLSQQLADRVEMLLMSQLAVRELMAFNRADMRALLGQGTSDRLAVILEARAESVRDALSAITLQYPTFAAALREQYLARTVLRLEAGDYERMFEDALISREVYRDLQHELAHRRAALEQRPVLDLGLKLQAMMRSLPMFTDLPADSVEKIGRLLRPRLAIPGEHVIRKGDKGDAMYFIANGQVEVRIPSGPIRLKETDFFGELALLHNAPRSADVVASGFCQLLALDRGDFHRFLRANPTLREQIERAAQARMSNAPA
jgi:CPA1 family monovalent cation:H+ antiporter